MECYITKFVVDSPWPGGPELFLLASGRGEKHFFGALRGGEPFFCPPDVVFISDDHVRNATSLICVSIRPGTNLPKIKNQKIYVGDLKIQISSNLNTFLKLDILLKIHISV